MYNWNIELIEKVRIAAWAGQWLAVVLLILLGVYVLESFFFIIPVVFGTMRGTYIIFKEHQNQKDSPDLAPRAQLTDCAINYSEGAGKYEIEVPYKNIIKVKYANILGFHRVNLTVRENQELTIWNLVNSRDLATELESACNKKLETGAQTARSA